MEMKSSGSPRRRPLNEATASASCGPSRQGAGRVAGIDKSTSAGSNPMAVRPASSLGCRSLSAGKASTWHTGLPMEVLQQIRGGSVVRQAGGGIPVMARVDDAMVRYGPVPEARRSPKPVAWGIALLACLAGLPSRDGRSGRFPGPSLAPLRNVPAEVHAGLHQRAPDIGE